MQFFGLTITQGVLSFSPPKFPFLSVLADIKERKRKILTHDCRGIKTVAGLMLVSGLQKLSVQSVYGFFYLGLLGTVVESFRRIF